MDAALKFLNENVVDLLTLFLKFPIIFFLNLPNWIKIMIYIFIGLISIISMLLLYKNRYNVYKVY